MSLDSETGSDSIQLFPIPEIEFKDTNDFISFLSTDYSENLKDLTIVAGLTERNKTDLMKSLEFYGFSLERQLGNVWQLSAPYKEEILKCYTSLDEKTGVVLFFTNYRKTEEVPKISDYLKSDSKSYYLFFTPYLLKKVIRNLLIEHDNVIISEFTGRRLEESKVYSQLRPEYKRTISYWGDDAKEVLEEIEPVYGVMVQRVVATIPDECKFGMDYRGFLTINWGKPEYPLRVLSTLIESSITAKKAYDTASYRVISTGTTGRTIEVGLSKPATIQLKRIMTFADVSDFESKLREEGYSIIKTLAQEGSLFLSSDVISANGQHFRIKSDGNQIRLYSNDKKDLHTFMHFFEFITEHVDPSAELIV